MLFHEHDLWELNATTSTDRFETAVSRYSTHFRNSDSWFFGYCDLFPMTLSSFIGFNNNNNNNNDDDNDNNNNNNNNNEVVQILHPIT